MPDSTEAPVYLVVGLGNPGARYQATRHNVGFMVIDRISALYGIKVSTRGCDSLWGRGRVDGADVVLAKPDTFMNLSGQAVTALMGRFKAERERILVICDDCELPFERIRLRKKGGSGGQKGLGSIIELLGTNEFPRLRMGVGSPEVRNFTGYVLSPFSKVEREGLDPFIERGAAAAAAFIKWGMNDAMNEFNPL